MNVALPAFLVAPFALLAGHFAPPPAVLASNEGSATQDKAKSHIAAVAAGPPLHAGRTAVLLSGGYLWLAFYSAIPHKEARVSSSPNEPPFIDELSSSSTHQSGGLPPRLKYSYSLSTK